MLDLLAGKHKMWISMLIKLGCHKDIAEDIVQEMYIKMHNKIDCVDSIMYHEDINRYFIYVVLRNMYISHIRNKGKMKMYPLIETDGGSEFLDELSEHEMESNYFYYIKDKLDDLVMSFSPYYRQLFLLYFVKGDSLTKMAEKTGLGRSSLYNHVNIMKNRIKDELLEDVEDLRNKDYKYI